MTEVEKNFIQQKQNDRNRQVLKWTISEQTLDHACKLWMPLVRHCRSHNSSLSRSTYHINGDHSKTHTFQNMSRYAFILPGITDDRQKELALACIAKDHKLCRNHSTCRQTNQGKYTLAGLHNFQSIHITIILWSTTESLSMTINFVITLADRTWESSIR